ncbi:unnamed protein product [Camellia sinensis]
MHQSNPDWVTRVTNLHQGYGFVEFRSEDDADYAIKVLNMIKLYGKPIRVNKASQDKKSLDVGANFLWETLILMWMRNFCMILSLHLESLLQIPRIGGPLNATFGNATELIISIHAMKSGLLRVVQQSLLGSILSNMLLVLGSAFFIGGISHSNKQQVFNKANAEMNSGLLLMAVMGLMFPAVLHVTHTELHYGKSELALSRFSSCVMLVAYAAYLFFQLKSQRNLYGTINEGDQEFERYSRTYLSYCS